jgi:hypothetical protein
MSYPLNITNAVYAKSRQENSFWFLSVLLWQKPDRIPKNIQEGVSRSFRTGRLERELQMVPLSATRCSCIAILWVSLVSFAVITLCVPSQRVFIVPVVYFVIDSVQKLLNIPSYVRMVDIFKTRSLPLRITRQNHFPLIQQINGSLTLQLLLLLLLYSKLDQ